MGLLEVWFVPFQTVSNYNFGTQGLHILPLKLCPLSSWNMRILIDVNVDI